MWSKKCIVYFLFFLTFFTAKAGSEKANGGSGKADLPDGRALYITIKCDPNFVVTSSSVSTATHSETKTTNTEPIRPMPQNLVPTSLDDLPEASSPGLFSLLFGNVRNSVHYTVRWGVGLSICGYLLVLTKLMRASRLIGCEGSWAVWRSDVPTAVLQELSVEIVANELYEAIQKKYIFAELQRNNLMLMGLFSRDVENELDRMHQFISLHARIDRMYMSPLFPKQVELIQQVHYYIDRLNFLQQVLDQWMHVTV